MGINRLPFGIGDFLVELKEIALKGDEPGHPFRGNQYEGGSGGNESPGGESSGTSSDVPSNTIGKNKKAIISNLKGKGLDPQIKKGAALRNNEVFVDNDNGVWVVTGAHDPLSTFRAARATAPYSDGSGLFSSGEKHFSKTGDYISAGNAKQYAKTLIKPRY